MKLLKVVQIICTQNLRKWRTDYRVWIIAILAVIMVWIYVDDMARIATGLGMQMPIWIYPFLYSQFHTKLIFTLPIVLLFSNAPFTDGNQIFVYMRTGKKKWLYGQILYIAAASGIYYLFLLAISLLSTIFSGGSISMEWGKTLTTIANSNAALYYNSPFISVSNIITTYFSPISAVWFTFLLSWLCGVMIGLIIFFCNSLSKTRFLGITITSLLVVLSALVDNGLPKFVPYSPISWNTLEKIDIGGLTSNPSFDYCIGIYLTIIVLLITGILIFGRKQSMDVKGK